MHQTRKGNQWHFGMKAHIGVDAEKGIVHSLSATAPTPTTLRRRATCRDAGVAGILAVKVSDRASVQRYEAPVGYQGVESRIRPRQQGEHDAFTLLGDCDTWAPRSAQFGLYSRDPIKPSSSRTCSTNSS